MSISLVKSRIAQRQEITMPRLELLGNLILARLLTSVEIATLKDVQIDHIYYWTDSKVCSSWINSEKLLMHSSIMELKKSIEQKLKWFYCESKNNPSDLLTKMVFSLSQLKEKKRELNVVVLNENLLRCEGRLQNASLTHDSKTPTLLNDKQKLAQLIVKNIHKCYKHIGLKHTSSELRQIFWIARGRNFV